MKTILHLIRPFVLTLMLLIGCVTSALAQEVSIGDPGLNAAIREALQKPNGPLTQQDLLSLTNLDASRRSIKDIDGLEAARNLEVLDLQINQLTNFSLPDTLRKLEVLDVSFNGMTSFSMPNAVTNLQVLTLAGNQLTDLTLPASLTQLNSLILENNQLSRFNQLANLTSLMTLDLSFNSFTNFSLPGGLTNLNTFLMEGNPLVDVAVPSGLTGLVELYLGQNQLTRFTLPAGMTNLTALGLAFNDLTNLTLPNDLRNLGVLDLDFNDFTRLDLPSNLIRLGTLLLRSNQLTNLHLPDDMRRLIFLDVGENQLDNLTLPAGLNHLEFLRASGNNLTSLTLPRGMTNLSGVFLRFNQLTNLTLSPDLFKLVQIDVLGNELSSLNLPSGLTNLATLVLSGNRLTELTLPPDIVRLSSLVLEGNPFTTLVLSEPLATTTLAGDVAALRNRDVSVFTYPLAVQLDRPQILVGAVRIGIKGPPGIYTVLGSTNLTAWEAVGMANNRVGAINFTDVTANASPRKFYRVLQQTPPPQMVFIASNTFTMGSRITELHRDTNEGPQTIVTLTRGFWIGKYEVTQGEYVSIMNTNPSQFPGDLSRPISTVSFQNATNYCWKLTQQELAAGRIPPGSRYRLPTEAEWECAARAGTTTRFSWGDDPDYTSITNYAWQNFEDGLTVHPVGQKLPNPWGLYDMAGNVFEWCQDWLGPLAGGAVTDPTGPDSSPIAWRIMRGGAFDFGGSACRSASRSFFGDHPALTDWNLGFRVVLVTGSQ